MATSDAGRIYTPLTDATREQPGPGLRVTFHQPYAVYCTALADAVVIIRVLQGARDVAALAEHGGFAGGGHDDKNTT